jgi:hypothetical protein
MFLPWSEEETHHLIDLMGYDGTDNIPDRPSHPHFPSWAAVAQGMEDQYLSHREAPRGYTISVVRDRWINYVLPRLVLAVSKKLLANLTTCIDRVEGFERDLVGMLEPVRRTGGKGKGRAVDLT